MASGGLSSLQLPPRDAVSPGPLSPHTSSTRIANPMSSKVTSVLSTSYADADFRDALALLDRRAVSNTSEVRRQLRSDVQKEVIDANAQILAEFGRVADQLRKIGTTVDKLNKSYEEMKSHVTAAREATSATLEEASNLAGQRENVETKQQLLHALRQHFVLTEDEVASLTMMNEPVDDRFFGALVKAKKIRKNCEVLLGFENQTLGLEIMDSTSKNLNLAFQKLYRWIQKEFKTLNLENPQISSSVRRALRVLAERPSLFQNCLDFFAEARQQILSDSFYLALNGTTASGTKDHSVKPIDLVAHDPLRYAGDMLAWTHSATVSEREALEVLFISEGGDIVKGLQEGRENELWRLMTDDEDNPPEFDATQALNDLVDRDVAGAARVLRQRIEQVIQTNEESILAYRLANLLNFYRITFSKLLGPESVLLEIMIGLESEALRQFRSLMRDQLATLQSDLQHTSTDLSPPDFFHDSLKQLTAIMQSYETSLSATEDRESEFEPIMAEAFEPFLEGCQKMARNMRAPADSIFIINCVAAAKHTLSPFDFTARRVSALEDLVTEHKNKMIGHQYEFFKDESSLEPLLAAMAPFTDSHEDIAKLRQHEALKPEALTLASQNLDDFLPSAIMDAMENIENLQDAGLAREITEDAAEKFCVDFERIEEMLIYADEQLLQSRHSNQTDDETPGYKSLFPRTTGEIRVLLS